MSFVTHALTVVVLSSMVILNVISPTKCRGWPFASSMATGLGYVMTFMSPKRCSTSSDKSDFVRCISNRALNLNEFFPVEGRGDILTVVWHFLFDATVLFCC